MGYNALDTRNYNSKSIKNIEKVIESLGGTPAQTTTVVDSQDVTESDRKQVDELFKDNVAETTERKTESDVEGGLSDAKIAEQFTKINPTVSSTGETISKQQAEALKDRAKKVDTKSFTSLADELAGSTSLPPQAEDTETKTKT